jgi:hypothetical protein
VPGLSLLFHLDCNKEDGGKPGKLKSGRSQERPGVAAEASFDASVAPGSSHPQFSTLLFSIGESEIR